MRHRKTVLIVFCTVLLLFAGIADAAEPVREMGYYSSPRERNLLYEEEPVSVEEALVSLAEEDPVPLPSEFFDTLEEAAAELRKGLKERREIITVGFRTTVPDLTDAFAHALFHLALSHTGIAGEGDYLTWAWKDRVIELYYFEENGLWHYIAYYEMNYYTTLEMEEELTGEIRAVLDELELYDRSDYEKIKGIYDYICSNVTFDNAHSGQASYTLKYTAYAALLHKTAVCQGFAQLYYQFACELGLDARIIFGKAGNVNHTWLIVRVGDSYFNLDPTWDAGKTLYSCFMKGEKDFPSHVRYDNPMCGLYYTSPAFYGAYPLAKEMFTLADNPMTSVSGTLGNGLTWKFGADCRLMIGGTGEVPAFADGEAPFDEYAACIHEIVIDGSVSAIGTGAFDSCTEVDAVSVSADTVVEEGAFSSDTEVFRAEKREIALYEGSAYTIAESGGGTRYLIAAEDGWDILSLVNAFDLADTDRVQLVSDDGTMRYCGFDSVVFGARLQLLDENGGVCDEVTTALRGDMNLDGIVDSLDAQTLLWSLITPEEYGNVPHYDLNGDGLTNASDAAALAMVFSPN